MPPPFARSQRVSSVIVTGLVVTILFAAAVAVAAHGTTDAVENIQHEASNGDAQTQHALAAEPGNSMRKGTEQTDFPLGDGGRTAAAVSRPESPAVNVNGLDDEGRGFDSPAEDGHSSSKSIPAVHQHPTHVLDSDTITDKERHVMPRRDGDENDPLKSIKSENVGPVHRGVRGAQAINFVYDSPTASETASESPTEKSSLTPTVTMFESSESGSSSETETSIFSASSTLSSSLSESRSITGSSTMSPSMSATRTISKTRSGSASLTRSTSRSSTPSISGSSSITPSKSPSVSLSVSTTRTISKTPSTTRTKSNTPSSSSSKSNPPSTSSTPTISQSISMTVTTTASGSLTPTSTPTISLSSSISLSPTASPTLPAVNLIAGGHNTCIILSTTDDNGLKCWGKGAHGVNGNGVVTNEQSVPGASVLSDVAAAAVGPYHSCAIVGASKTLYCWGFDGFGQLGKGGSSDVCSSGSQDCQLTPFSLSLTGVLHVAVGYHHSCAVTSSNGVRCWGSNSNGQLGYGGSEDTSVNSVPATDVLTGVSAVTCGAYHTCVLMSANGGVRCWGSNVAGQLGTGNYFDLNVPSSDVITGAVSIAAGAHHTCVIVGSVRGVRCWGRNSHGQLGISSSVPTSLAVPPTTNLLVGARSLATGKYHTCVLSGDNGDAFCWGSDIFGQLGDGAADNTNQPAVSLASPVATNVLQITGSLSDHTCLVTSSNEIKCWGLGESGQLGRGDVQNLNFVSSNGITASPTPSFTPTTSITATNTPVAAVAVVGDYNTCLHFASGDKGMRCWGFGLLGGVGNGDNTTRNTVPQTNILTGVEQASAGGYHVCAVVGSSRQLYCWGDDTYGQLGVGGSSTTCTLMGGWVTVACARVPAPVPFAGSVLTGVHSVATGEWHTCALLADNGAVKCWGSNGWLELGYGEDYLQTSSNSVPEDSVISGVVALSCGGHSCCVIVAVNDGVKCWGNSVGSPSDYIITGVSAISVGLYHRCVIMKINDGLRCWGSNGNGQLGVGDTYDRETPDNIDILTGVREVSVGRLHTCAVTTSTNELRCWGYNGLGQTGNGGEVDFVMSPPTAPLHTNVVRVFSHIGDHTCAVVISSSLDIRCWGNNRYGQLGNGNNSNVLTFPTSGIMVP